MNWIIDHFYNIVCGMICAILAYFAELQGAVHVMWAALVLDLITGIMASMIKRGEKFCMAKAFTAICRAIGASFLVMLLFAMDKEMHQDAVASYNIAAWLICGFYAWSSSENLDELTGGKIFGILKGFIGKRVEDTTGIHLDKTEIQSGR
jgi:phage-related holin